jgi:hypothetical protein
MNPHKTTMLWGDEETYGMIRSNKPKLNPL